MRRNSVLCFLITVMFFCTIVLGQSMLYAAENSAKVEISSGFLTGIVTDMDKKALSNIPIMIMDVMGKVKYSAFTDEQGSYAIKDVVSGTYSLIIADSQEITLEVKQRAGKKTINVMLPQNAQLYTSGSIGSFSTPILFAVGGGVVLVAASVYGISQYDSDAYTPVSP